eukprot:259434-Chlamydomonas_euryale.AAC.1
MTLEMRDEGRNDTGASEGHHETTGGAGRGPMCRGCGRGAAPNHRRCGTRGDVPGLRNHSA